MRYHATFGSHFWSSLHEGECFVSMVGHGVVERAADPDGLAGAEPGAVDRHRRVDSALQELHAHGGLGLPADRTLEFLSGDVDRLDRDGQNDGS